LREIFENDLITDPKRHPKKIGRNAGKRAVPLKFRGKAWRAVFTVDENSRGVRVQSLGPHDQAYKDAEKRN
jgi:hypothetical protein